MSKKQKHAVTLADVVSTMGPPPTGECLGLSLPSPASARGFTDSDGNHWRLVRGPLDPRRAKRLAAGADVMSMGEHYDDRGERWFPRFLTAEERRPAWLEAAARYGAADLPAYEAYEFTAADGRVLLFIETYC